MSFVEERLLDCVSYGTEGGPTWSTRRIGLKSGVIRRNAQRARPLYRFIILYQNLKPSDYQEVIRAFNACLGGVYGFRLKDWSDFEGTDEFVVVATGIEQTVQLTKTYDFGALSLSRTIRKPVADTVTLTSDDVPLALTSIDTTTGEVVFTAPVGETVRWSGEFDVPVMFENDELMMSAGNRTADGLVLTADVGLMEDISA